MNYLTNLYRYKAEQLQEQVKLLEAKLKALEEAVVLPGPVSRETKRFEDSMVDRPRTVPVGYKNPTEAPELLARDRSMPQIAGVDVEGPPSALRDAPSNNPAPALLARDPNVPTPPAKGSPAPVAGGSRSTQSAPTSNSMMSPFSSAPQRKPTEIVADTPSQPDWLASATAPLTLPGSQPTEKTKGPSDVLAATKNLLDGMNRKKEEADKAGPGRDFGNLGMSQAQIDAANKAQSGKFGGDKQSAPAQQTAASPSFDPFAGIRKQMAGIAQQQANASTAASKPSAPAQKPGFHPNGKPMVQRTSDPNVSTYEAGGYVSQTPPPPMGKIQLGQEKGEWAKRQLEQEVGFSTKGQGLQNDVGNSFMDTTRETIAQMPAAIAATLMGAAQSGLDYFGKRGMGQIAKQTRQGIERSMQTRSNENPNFSGTAGMIDTTLNAVGPLGDVVRDVVPSVSRNSLANMKAQGSEDAMRRYREEEQAMIRRFQKP